MRQSSGGHHRVPRPEIGFVVAGEMLALEAAGLAGDVLVELNQWLVREESVVLLGSVRESIPDPDVELLNYDRRNTFGLAAPFELSCLLDGALLALP